MVNYCAFISRSPKFCNSLTIKVTVNCLQFPSPAISLLNYTHMWLAASFLQPGGHPEDNSSFLPSHAKSPSAMSLPSVKMVARDSPWNVVTCQQKKMNSSLCRTVVISQPWRFQLWVWSDRIKGYSCNLYSCFHSLSTILPCALCFALAQHHLF